MNPPIVQMWRGRDILCAATAFLLAGCVTSPTLSRTVYDDSTLLVRLDSLAPQPEGPSGEPNRRHTELTADDLAAVLRSVRIKPEISFADYWILRKEPQLKPAFPDRDADLLAAHLEDALAKARPHETVVFSLRRVREDGIPLVTTGALILHGDQLILILANARRPTTTQRKLDTARETPLQVLGELDFHFAAGPSQTVLTAQDLSNTIGISSTPALSIDYGAWRPGVLAPGRSPSPSYMEPAMSTATMDEKLHQLKIWHEQGLITSDEYLQKRQEILRQF